jgi:RNA polymerase sigma-70 factor (ECF subfamily)
MCCSASDEELLAASDRCPEAFGVLAGRYREPLSRFAFHYVRDRDTARDVVQDALLHAFKHRDSVERGRPFRPWLFAIARNASFSALRHRRRAAASVELCDTFASSAPGPEELALLDADARSVHYALATLPERYRTALQLYYLSHMRYREIAAALGIPIGTVKTHISRAKRLLRAELEDAGLGRSA